MKQQSFTKLCAGAYISLLAVAFSGCVEKDLYDPNYGKNQLLPKEEYFGFELRGEVSLSVDYKAPGFQPNFRIYAEDPIAVPSTVKLKEGVQPIYSAFADKDGKFDGTMKIPTATKEVWLYTDCFGLASCVKLPIIANSVTYDANAVTPATRSASSMAEWFKGNGPYDLRTFGLPYGFAEDRYYASVKWTTNGDVKSVNTATDIFETAEINGEKIGAISGRIQSYLGTLPLGEERAKMIISKPSVANIRTKENGTKLNMVFLDERGEYTSSLGYYYYKAGSSVDKTVNGGDSYYFVVDFAPVKKYIVFPHAAIDGGPLKCGTTAALKFYGPNGNQPGTYEFPKDYVVGFFGIPQGFITTSNNTIPQYGIIDGIRTNDPEKNQWGFIIATDDMKGSTTDFRRFISLYDEKSKSVVIGMEDRKNEGAPDDYCDISFIVTSNVDLNGTEKPEIPNKPTEPKIETFTESGTLAFEDQWPVGDYDLNDVVVEYERYITFGEDNKAISAEEKFTFVQAKDAATNDNFFAYVAKFGTIQVSEDLLIETGTNSLVIKQSAKNNREKTFTVKRTFSGSTTKDEAIADFDPYIIVGAYTTSNRTEVHLPKHSATAFANQSLIGTGNDAYFIDYSTGLYPFAIDIPVLDYTLVTEKNRIDAEGEYPDFKKWAVSNGGENKEWYLNYKGGKK